MANKIKFRFRTAMEEAFSATNISKPEAVVISNASESDTNQTHDFPSRSIPPGKGRRTSRKGSQKSVLVQYGPVKEKRTPNKQSLKTLRLPTTKLPHQHPPQNNDWADFVRKLEKERQSSGVAKKSSGKKSVAEYLAFLNEVYGGSHKRSKPKPTPAQTHLPHVTGVIGPNLSAFSKDLHSARLVPQHDGIGTALNPRGDDATDIVIGLDFGTSSVKVILGDANSRGHFAVPFYEIGGGNPYLFPSCVFLSNDEYSLEYRSLPEESVIRDIKLTLLQRPDDYSYMIHATAFLALIVRHARGWLFSAHADTYRNTQIVWSINLGLPAEKSEDRHLSGRFKALALAAINLAEVPGTITRGIAGATLKRAVLALKGGTNAHDLSVPSDLIGVFPEVAAQVVAFVESERWDSAARPYVTMIDIGAGTVDVAFFSIEKASNRKFSFFMNKVEENGVMNLHRERILWLKSLLPKVAPNSFNVTEFLDEIFRPTDRIGPIPNSVDQYLTGLSFSGTKTVDDEFFAKRYRHQVFSEVIRPSHKSRAPKGDHWKDLPVFVCGGGSRMPIYSGIIDSLNSIPGVSWLHSRRYYLSKPQRLIAPGLVDAEYDRLSVAYGLSFESVGQIIRSVEIDDFVVTPKMRETIEAPGPEVC